VGPVWESTGKLNPFAVADRARGYELADRPRLHLPGDVWAAWPPALRAFNNASNDYALMADVIQGAGAPKYAYDPERPKKPSRAEMEALGATLVAASGSMRASRSRSAC
jgi:hypothetical protein